MKQHQTVVHESNTQTQRQTKMEIRKVVKVLAAVTVAMLVCIGWPVYVHQRNFESGAGAVTLTAEPASVLNEADNYRPRQGAYPTTTLLAVAVRGVTVIREPRVIDTDVAPQAPEPVEIEPVDAAPGDVEAYILQVWTEAGYGHDAAKAVRIARCESGLRPDARNGSHYGIFQIAWTSKSSVPASALYDYRYNIEVAIDMYIGAGASFRTHWAATVHC